jgi:hypothetical protein
MMGIQPILTLCVVERRLQGRRLLGLLLALAGLVLQAALHHAKREDGLDPHHGGDKSRRHAVGHRLEVTVLLALAGLVLLVWRSLAASPMAMAGILFALAALLLMTIGDAARLRHTSSTSPARASSSPSSRRPCRRRSTGDPVCAGGFAADDFWRAVAKAQPSVAGGCPAAAVRRTSAGD